MTVFVPNMAGFVLNMTIFVINMTGFVLRKPRFVLNITGFVLKMTVFVLNMTGFVLNITGFIKQQNLDIMEWPYTRSNPVLVYTRRYGPLRRLIFSSCEGVRPLAGAFLLGKKK